VVIVGIELLSLRGVKDEWLLVEDTLIFSGKDELLLKFNRFQVLLDKCTPQAHDSQRRTKNE
jgi:hypothetical protein